MKSILIAVGLLFALSAAAKNQFNVHVVLTVRGDDRHVPLLLGTLDKFNFPKNRIHVWIGLESRGEMIPVVKEWVDNAESDYKSIYFREGRTKKRTLKSMALDAARYVGSRYVLFIGSNAFIHYKPIIEHLITTVKQTEATIIIPQLSVFTDDGKQSKNQIVDITGSLFVDLQHFEESMDVATFMNILTKGKGEAVVISDLEYGYVLHNTDTNEFNRKFEKTLAFKHELHVSDHLTAEQSEFSKYFDMVYVINLRRRPKRLAHAKNTIYYLGITNVNYTEAVDGLYLANSELQQIGYKTLEGYADRDRDGGMLIGQIACLLSHVNIWKNAEQNNYGRILILEDDADLIPSYAKFHDVWKLMQQEMVDMARKEGVLTPWELLQFQRWKKIRSSKDKKIKGSRYMVDPAMSSGATAYAVSRIGIRKLLGGGLLSRGIPVDDYINVMYNKYWNNTILQSFQNRDLRAAATEPMLMKPAIFSGYAVSDTEDKQIGKLVEPRPKIIHNEL